VRFHRTSWYQPAVSTVGDDIFHLRTDKRQLKKYIVQIKELIMMELPKIDVQQLKLPQLLNEMKAGRLQVPRFQRKFVWSLSKTRRLLDSMYKEFPIGTFFLWRAPTGSPRLFRSLPELGIPEPQSGMDITYILDGQQRLSSLHVTINGYKLGRRDYGRISIDLEAATHYDQSTEEGFEEDIFVYHSGDDRRYVSVCDLVSSEHLMIFKNIPEAWQSAFNKAYNIFQTYPFSVVWIQEQELSDAIEIFQRINQAGKRLSRYDLICANVWTENFNFRKRIDSLNRDLARKGFGRLKSTIFTQTFALILKDRCTTAAELSLNTDEIVENWDRVIRAIELAIDFASTNLGVKRAEYFPYRGIVPVLAYYFYHASKSALSIQERQTLWEWFWRVSLSERYSSTSPSRMAEDALKLREMLSGQSVTFDYRPKVTPEAIRRNRMTRTTSALRNAAICMFVLRQPRSLKDNSPVNLQDQFFSSLKKAERHHIFPVGHLKDQGISGRRVHALPNFCFIPSDLNREIGKQAPADYLLQYREGNPLFEAAANSHLLPIDKDSAVWDNDFNSFLEERAELIAKALQNLVESSPDEFAEPSKVKTEKPAIEIQIDLIEVRLRDLIDHRLTAMVGTHYWKPTMPGDIIGYTKERIKQHLEEHPYKDWSDYPPGRSRLDFCTTGQYYQIFRKNWQLFAEIFGKERELERHLAAYNALRNAIKHNREPSDIQIANGEAAIKWLGRILDKYEEEYHNNMKEIPEEE